MKRKKQLLMTLFCSATLVGQSLTGLAQDKAKTTDKVEKHVFINQDGKPVEVTTGTWVGGPGEEGVAHFTYAAGAGGAVFSTTAPGPQVNVIANEFSFDGKVVKGAPYSADGVTETIQILSDGNRIVRTSSAKIYRDSLGRTRREQAINVVGSWPVNGEAPKSISINDPVANTQYTLNPVTKIANKMTVQRFARNVAVPAGGEKVSIARAGGSGGKVTFNGQVEEVNGGQFTFVTDDNQKIVLSGETGERAAVELKAQAEADAVRAAKIQAEGEMLKTTVATAGPIATFTMAPGAQINKEALGTQVIEGVQAEGTRITITIPAGQIGNERPIVTTNERWYSPELQTVVMTKNSDPRSGETTYRLTNLNRNEPDPALFQVPTDYTVKEGGFAFGTGTMMKKIEAEKKAKNPNDN
jgi:hypothetical protein